MGEVWRHMKQQESDLYNRVPLSVPTGCPQSPMSKATLTLITVCTCVVAVVYGTQTSCPLTVKVTLHVPEHFIADGEQSIDSHNVLF